MCYLQIQSKWYINPKSDEKNVRIPSKSPWKSSNSPCQRTMEIIRPFLFRPFVQVVPPQLWCFAILTKSHWKMFPPQKLTIFNKNRQRAPLRSDRLVSWMFSRITSKWGSGRWLEDVRFDRFVATRYAIWSRASQLQKLEKLRSIKINFDVSYIYTSDLIMNQPFIDYYQIFIIIYTIDTKKCEFISFHSVHSLVQIMFSPHPRVWCFWTHLVCCHSSLACCWSHKRCRSAR